MKIPWILLLFYARISSTDRAAAEASCCCIQSWNLKSRWKANVFIFSTPAKAALSCHDLFIKSPNNPSGTYWIQSADGMEKMRVNNLFIFTIFARCFQYLSLRSWVRNILRKNPFCSLSINHFIRILFIHVRNERLILQINLFTSHWNKQHTFRCFIRLLWYMIQTYVRHLFCLLFPLKRYLNASKKLCFLNL